MPEINLSSPGRTIQAGVILLGGVTEILDVGPIDMLNGLSKHFMHALPVSDELKAKAIDVDFHWVTESGKPAKLTAGATVNATDSFETCPTLDIVLIGAYFLGYEPSEKELDFIKKSYNECSAFILICGGFIPAQLAGVLAGHTCTAPRFLIPELTKQDTRTKWTEKRYERSGKVWTSGALLNGLDLMGEFAKTYWPELAEVAVPLGGYPERSVEYPASQVF